MLAEPNGNILLVAESPSGEVAGYTLGRPGECDIAPYDSELVALHVRKEFQGQGTGEALVRAMARELYQTGCRSMMLWVLEQNPARAFYQRLGGELIGEKQTHLGEGDVSVQEVAYGWPEIETLFAVEAK
ncbi:MAG: GNAT family N-acetyltransferase [Chloroflexota bacterium]